MNEKILAYCGLHCHECPIFIATKNNDQAAKEELAAKYSSERCQFVPGDMNCAGCFKVDIENSKMCSACKIRDCAVQRELENCGVCQEYPCEIVVNYLPEDSTERGRLDQIHANM